MTQPPIIPTIVSYDGMMWAAAKARKPNECVFSRRKINVGDIVYRPISKGNKRMQRILATERFIRLSIVL